MYVRGIKMKLKNVKKYVAALCSVCILGATTLTVNAETLWFNFRFTNVTTQELYDASASKADNEQNWYLTLVNYNIETGYADSTLSSTNKFGCKLHRVSGGADNVDIYRVYNNHFTGKRIAYQNTVHKGDAMKIKAKKDNSSTSSAALRVYGKYTP